jgi:Mg2+ and Co2+ transporter CorA
MGQHDANRNSYIELRETLTTESNGDYAFECGVHLERTLDEAYFPGLTAQELHVRNLDQVVSSKFRADPEFIDSNLPIVIVSQLWLWRYGDFIVSAHSTRSDLERVHHLGVRHAILHMGLIIAECIQSFGKELILTNGTKIPPTLDLFESRVVSILSEVKEYIGNSKRNAIEYDTEAKFHHILSDCRSELAMIQHFLAHQEEVLKCLLDDRSQYEATLISGDKAFQLCVTWQPVEDAHNMLKQYQKRVQRIDGDTERIEKSVQDLLSLKRTFASVQDSHASVLVSVAAIGFAIVTIIFAPLAFLVGLFALNLQGFESLRVHTDDDVNKGAGAIGNAATEQGTTLHAVSNKDTIYHSGKITGIFSELHSHR